MKKIYLLIVGLLLAFLLQAQIVKTVEVTPGKLNSLLTQEELKTITDLTITGTMDARDFRTMRDEMPQLVNLDMRQATIAQYSGTDGTFSQTDYDITYYPLTIPIDAFLSFEESPPGNNHTLQSVQIPLNTLTIGESAFGGCTALTSFTVPPSVTTIGQAAFYGCTGLTSFIIPPTVTFLGWAAFSECRGLTKMVIPSSITSMHEYVFQKCSGLISIELPSTITIIENNAFEGCSSLTSINVPSGLTSIGKSAFEGCGALAAFPLPGGITFIGESAFYGCSNMAGPLILPQGIRNIERFSFYKCSRLTSLQLPAAVDSIRESAFDGCSALSGPLSLPSTLGYIGIRAFANCSSLTGQLILPSLVKVVESYSFAGCSGLSSLTIPESVLSIHTAAFKGCSSFTAIDARRAIPVSLYPDAGVFDGVDKSIPLHIPFGARELYALAEGWKDFTNIEEEAQGMLLSATSAVFAPEGGSSTIILKANVNWSAVADQPWLSVSPSSGNNTQLLTLTTQANQSMTSRKGIITISAPGEEPQTIHVSQGAVPTVITTTTGNFCKALTLEQWNSITHLTITGTMNAPEISVLKAMPLLSEVDMSRVSITPFHIRTHREDYYYAENEFPGYQGYYTYDYSLRFDSSLTSIVLPATLERIAGEAFEGCINLNSVVFPSALITIGDNAFMNCTALKSVQVPSSVIEMNYGAFNGCSSLTIVELAEGITALKGTFEACTSLRNIRLPSTLKIIGENTFKNCSELAHIDIPPLVTTIGGGAFQGCTALSSLALPSVVTTIGSVAFAGCSSLTSVFLPRSLTYIGANAFLECRNLESVYSYAVQPPLSAEESYGPLFWYVDMKRCTLYVPVGSKALYEKAPHWKYFENIVEMEGFTMPVNSISLGAGRNSTAVAITSGIPWTATADQSWLNINPSSSAGNASVTITAEANPSTFTRQASVKFTVNQQPSQDITVIQQGLPATIDLAPGSLSSAFGPTALRGITRLTITGTMDARDFKTIRDRMPALTVLDLSAATIAAYSGREGTISSYYFQEGDTIFDTFNYPANGIPPTALSGSSGLITTITLPASLTSIGSSAFAGLSLLDTLEIPSSVSSIGRGAFSQCGSLTSLVLPPSLLRIEDYLCSGCSLTTINIPSHVTSIGTWAFGNCKNLTSVYSYVPYPLEITFGRYDPDVIFGIDKSRCTLYVPYGAAYAYRAALNEWKEFTNVVEMPGFRLSAVTVAVKAAHGSMAKVGIKSDVQWTVISDQTWLSISPTTGTGADTLTFTAQANTMDAGRMATVTISSPDVVAQTITVIQEGKPWTIALTPGNMASVLTAEQMNVITHLTITGTMDARDFRVLRDQMPLLTYLDMSQAKISAFQEMDKLTGKPIIYRENEIPDSAFFNIHSWQGKVSLTSVVFPFTLEKIGYRAFSHAAGLRVLRIPVTVKFIESNAFNSLPYLDSVFSYALMPPESHTAGTGFNNVDNTRCTLYVPSGSKPLYAAAEQWKAFKNIVEMATFKIITTSATLKATKDVATVSIHSDVPWNADPGVAWLTVSPASGNNKQTITITAEANPMELVRTGIVAFRATGYLPQIFTVYQEGQTKTINLTAGNMASLLTAEELSKITSLVITGTMDARDFKIIRDHMPWLASLDLTGATITAYSGNDGTAYMDYNYKANAIPPAALYTNNENIKSRLSTVLLPSSITLIDGSAFGESTSLTSIIIPQSVTTIDRYAFYGSRALQTVVISEGVDSIRMGAFSSSFALTSITIPSSVRYIGNEAFGNLGSLRAIYSYATIPLELSDTTHVFWQADTDSCVLYVPSGSRALYAAANQWKEFTHIVEMTDLALSATELTMEAVPAVESVKITTKGKWSAVSDKEWLTISPASGDSTQTIDITALENTTFETRIATVTFSAANGYSQTITITQHGLITGIDQKECQMAITCYPTPFTQQLTIEVANPTLKEVSAEIFSMSGQKIKTLAKALKGEKISLVWDGEDGQGKQVPAGMFLLKVNGETRKIMKE